MEWYYDNLVNWNSETEPLPNVVSLCVSNEQLTELPQNIFKLVTLKKLRCYNNKLTKIPKEIGQLTSLQFFFCSNNKLTELPEEIGNIASLQILLCSNNKLTKIPREIEKLTSLHTFICLNNNISTLPEEMLILDNLKCFKAYDNPFEYSRFERNVNNITEIKKYFYLTRRNNIRASAQLKIQRYLLNNSLIKQRLTKHDDCLII